LRKQLINKEKGETRKKGKEMKGNETYGKKRKEKKE